MSDHWSQLLANWRSALDALPFITLATGAPTVDMKDVIKVALSSVIAGVIAGQITVIRLEERVASLVQRMDNCEATLSAHMLADSQNYGMLRERIATCEARSK